MKTVVLSCPYGNITDIADGGNAFGVNKAGNPLHKSSCLRSSDFDNVACSG
jgi:hypothetical protein